MGVNSLTEDSSGCPNDSLEELSSEDFDSDGVVEVFAIPISFLDSIVFRFTTDCSNELKKTFLLCFGKQCTNVDNSPSKRPHRRLPKLTR
ncbi:hypothetical protein KC19_8G074100 [Ceratodon purpureus]|uniref:Uncharacterized protein n=1 Tax=Ceratodon purpureus TaxID=3225 RepID=A0A8T0H4F2_CERPU|nr:hypothetical protein KC19_8G074100 [Ceratodon purpureus]